MIPTKRFLRAVLPLVAAFVLGALAVGQVGAHTGFPKFLHSGHSDTMNGTLKAKGFKFKTRKTGVLVVGASAFQPMDSGCGWSNPGYGGALIAESACLFSANVDLPSGARITKVRWFHDTVTTPAGDGDMILEGDDPLSSGGGYDTLTSISADTSCTTVPCIGADATIPLIPGVNPVNNLMTHYTLSWDVAVANFRMAKVIVFYTVANPGTR
jgi:hypothetical protein